MLFSNRSRLRVLMNAVARISALNNKPKVRVHRQFANPKRRYVWTATLYTGHIPFTLLTSGDYDKLMGELSFVLRTARAARIDYEGLARPYGRSPVADALDALRRSRRPFEGYLRDYQRQALAALDNGLPARMEAAESMGKAGPEPYAAIAPGSDGRNECPVYGGPCTCIFGGC